MCNKFILVSDLETIENRFNVRLETNILAIPKMFSVSCGDSSYIITSQNQNVIQIFNFGMTPSFSKEPLNLINARAEGDKNLNNDPNYNGSKSIFLKPAFMKQIQSQRCTVIADAYYEWSSQNKPYLVYLQNKNRPFSFAGIYDSWKNPESEEISYSFAIITTTANSLLQSIGVKRMPVILSRSNELQWIKSSKHLSDVLRLLVSYPSEKMNAYPVSDMVSIQGLNDPSMVNPIGEKLLIETSPVKFTGGYHHKVKSKSERNWFESNPNLQPPK